MIRAFADRDDPDAIMFRVRKSEKDGAELTERARGCLTMEYCDVLLGDTPGTVQQLADHYGVDERLPRKLRARARETRAFSSRPRTGRPTTLTDAKKALIRELIRANPKLSLRDLAAETGLRRETIRVHINDVYLTKAVKPRPRLSDANVEERKTWVTEQVARLADADDTLSLLGCDGDEKYFVIPGFSGAVRHHRDDPVPESAEKLCGTKRHLPKIMMLGIISQPEWVWEVDEHSVVIRVFTTTGLIGIWRVQADVKAGRGKITGYVAGPRGGRKPLYEYRKGDLVRRDVTMDGFVYRDMMTREGGGLEAISAYFGEATEVDFQEDGAPGHGYSNHRGHAPTVPHQEMTTAAEARHIHVHKQPANSPETNALDLGVWWSLDAAVRKRADEFQEELSKADILDKLEQVVTEEFWKLPAEAIENVFLRKWSNVRHIDTDEGTRRAGEAHTGIRKRKAAFLKEDEAAARAQPAPASPGTSAAHGGRQVARVVGD